MRARAVPATQPPAKLALGGGAGREAASLPSYTRQESGKEGDDMYRCSLVLWSLTTELFKEREQAAALPPREA